MAFDQSSSGPILHEMTPTTISSGLVPKPTSSTTFVPLSRSDWDLMFQPLNDWDLLFQPLFDELLNPPLSVDNQDAEVIAPIAEVIPQVDEDSTAMDSEQSSSGPALQDMIPGTISSGIVQKPSSSTSFEPPSRNDWDLPFQPLFDELLNPSLSVDNQDAEVIAPIAEVIPPVDDDSTGSPSSTAIDQDAPPPSKSLTLTEIQSPNILQDDGNDNLDIEVAHMGND
nr:hypothetical protein [Tanacetum cinerariifolium]